MNLRYLIRYPPVHTCCTEFWSAWLVCGVCEATQTLSFRLWDGAINTVWCVLYVPYPYVKAYYNIYVKNQQMCIDKICYIIYYYSQTCFGRYCNQHQCVTQEYKKYTNNCTECVINPLTRNDLYSGRSAPLTSKRCILYIYSTNTGTEYFKHGIYSPFFPFKMQFVS